MGIFAAPLISLTGPLIQAGVAAVGSAAILAANRSGNSSENTSSNGNGSSSTSDGNRSSTTNSGTGQSNRRETDDTGAGGSGAGGNGNGGGGNGNGDRKKTDHELDNQSEDEDNNNEKQQQRTSNRRVSTAWLEAVDLRDPSEKQFFIRFRVPDYAEKPNPLIHGLRLPHVGPYQPRSHLIYRSRMFFYGIGRLQKLCNELGLNMKDICQFGTSVYKDARPGKITDKSELYHYAHVFPVTDFNFDLIRQRIRQRNPNKTQEEIKKLILDLENILMNMVGETESVHKAVNAAGTVGRALDNFLKDFIQKNRNVNSGNIQQIVNSMVECLRSAIKPESREEIEAAIQTIQSTSASEWMRYFNDGLNGVHDNHYNQRRRTIDENIKKLFDKNGKKDGKKDQGK